MRRGFTLLETLLALAIAALVVAALGGVVGQALESEAETRDRNDVVREARLAMERMEWAVRRSPGLLVPRADNPATAWDEAVREPGVLAVLMDPTLDRDRDGISDANSDRDFLDLDNDGVWDPGEPERIDEDVAKDATEDGANGLVGIDDDGDGQVDEGGTDAGGKPSDDDEDGLFNEDPINGRDDDGDGAVDEDPSGDMNDDAKAGVATQDDDLDGLVDETQPPDDDEDGLIDEDRWDPVVYFLSGSTLRERLPNPHPTSGTDYAERDLASSVTRFRVERLVPSQADAVVVALTLELTSARGHVVELESRVRVGGGR